SSSSLSTDKLSLDEFICSVCLDTLTDPVTIPCGHNFCLKCLTDCWDYSQEFFCPQCRENFSTRPHHKLVDPERNLKEKLCEKHQKSLEMFCRTDETCICMMCGVTEHNGHKMVELETEREEKEVSGHHQSLTECKGASCAAPDCPVTHSQISSLVFFSLLSDFCPLTLDINTAHRELRLSEGNKKVTFKGTKAKYPDHPDRFDCWYQVLCREALTGTRCYWEVEGSGDFMRIGVACKGLSRKGWGNKCGLGYNNKSWCLLWSDSQYSVRYNNQHTVISAPYSPRIGVYLDWPAGSLSFYSVSHTMTLLHRFNTSFTEPLYPGFCVDPHCGVTISHLTPCDH
uniref:Uncharacterized protein n=1 Tax=Erpetoichthys calabaricus TaxID=27687 RepID=A0A8C4RLF0_ERPCA